jgi:hypothetical protein
MMEHLKRGLAAFAKSTNLVDEDRTRRKAEEKTDAEDYNFRYSKRKKKPESSGQTGDALDINRAARKGFGL